MHSNRVGLDLWTISILCSIAPALSFTVNPRQASQRVVLPDHPGCRLSQTLGDSDDGESLTEKALFGMGCFWAPQEDFSKLYGVKKATTGYARATGGTDATNDPVRKESPASYFSTCAGDGRTESVLVEYDPSQVSYKELLRTFWQGHDASTVYPFEKGDQYRSCLFPMNEEQRELAVADILIAEGAYRERGMSPPRTFISDLPSASSQMDRFSEAESIHQQFWAKFKLKLAVGAAATLYGTTGDDVINGIVAQTGTKIVALWMLWELWELGSATAKSLNPFESTSFLFGEDTNGS